jgi:hypothetical protein
MIDPEFFFESIRKDNIPVKYEDEEMTAKGPSDYITFASTGFSPMPKHAIPSYYIPPASDLQQPFSGVFNSCGQCVMATLLTYWNVIGYNIYEVESIWKHPKGQPDIAAGVLGTSWERVRDYLKYRSMNGFGGCTQRLSVTSYQGKLEWLMGWANNGFPVAVIVGNGELQPGSSGAHWVIVGDINEQTVDLHNMGYKPYKTDTPTFMKAWEAAGLPWTHYAAAVMYK